jgi:membrane-bound lytic murein transglycosylase MltF
VISGLFESSRVSALGRAALCLFLIALPLSSCRGKESAPASPSSPPPPPSPAPTLAEQVHDDAYLETGDLPALVGRGRLRILAQRRGEDYLPRAGYPHDQDRALAGEFASGLGLEPVMVYVDSFGDLIPALLAGKGDVVADNMAITPERKKLIAFASPLLFVREQIIARAGSPRLSGVSALSGRSVGVQEGTSFLEALTALRKKHPEIAIDLLPGHLTSDDILDRVAAGSIDLAVDDSNVLAVALRYRSDVAAVLDLPGERALAWAVRPGNPELLRALNEFLTRERITSVREEKYLDDLPDIRRRKSIRMITRNHPSSYFLWRGELMGFEYELAKEFAHRQGLRLQVQVVPDRESLFSALTGGEGDFIAASLPPDSTGPEIALSPPYRRTDTAVSGDGSRPDFSAATTVSVCWAVRSSDRLLAKEIDAFLASVKKEPLLNQLSAKYARAIGGASPETIREYREANLGERISPYDDLARRYGEKFGFLWRAIVSQMYQESRFDPRARSWSGAVGLMQVQPQTAGQFGFRGNLDDPETGIHAGVVYLDWLRKRFEPELDLSESMLFTLAAYNAGIGHVTDARRLAKNLGLDDRRWFGHVEKAIRLLARPEYAEKARHGYVHGEIPANYVRQIVDRFRAYSAFSAQSGSALP